MLIPEEAEVAELVELHSQHSVESPQETVSRDCPNGLHLCMHSLQQVLIHKQGLVFAVPS